MKYNSYYSKQNRILEYNYNNKDDIYIKHYLIYLNNNYAELNFLKYN